MHGLVMGAGEWDDEIKEAWGLEKTDTVVDAFIIPILIHE